MRFLILNTNYPEFQHWLYAQHPGLEQQPYKEQMRVRMESLFGVADFYSSNLRDLGHTAWDVHVSNEFAQKAWAKEHGLRIEEPTPSEQRARTVIQRARRIGAKTPFRYVKPLFRPVLRSLDGQPAWFYDTLVAQIKHYKPDILLNQAMKGISVRFLEVIKPYVRLLVGQHAATQLPDSEDWSCYDLVISSFPPTVKWFRQEGIPSELHRLGFEPRVLNHLNGNEEKTIPTSFVGSFHPVHSSRTRLIERLCTQLDIQVWGANVEHLSADSPIRKSYKGYAWGIDMYRVFHKSKITLNHHGDVAPYANNLRLYEATGVGTLLITDWKVNLNEMFEPGREAVAYRSPEECVELIQYYLEHDDEREAIARAGQQRTLQEHTYYHRMQELVDIARKYL